MGLKCNITSLLLVSAIGLGAATSMAPAADKVYHIGEASFGEAAEYLHKWTNDIQQHPWVKNGKVKITVFDARFDPLVQSDQIDSMIAQHYDAIIISAVDFKAGGAAINRAVAAGIPVVGSILTADSDRLTSFIGTDDVGGMKMLTEMAAKLIGGSGGVVLLEGQLGASTQIARRKGFDEGLAENKRLELIASKSANWTRAEGLTVMEDWLLTNRGKIKAVFAENDEMALGAIEAIKGAGIDPVTMPVLSMDGIDDGLRAVKEGSLYVTLHRDVHAEGQGSLDLVLRALVGSGYKPQSPVWGKTITWGDGTNKLYTMPWGVVTAKTVGEYLK